MRSGAGLRSHFADAAYKEAGAEIAGSDEERGRRRRYRPDRAAARSLDIVKSMKKGAAVIGMLDPFSDAEGLAALAKSGVALFAMELMPRISRAQSMDVLSSQSNLAGYKAVVDAAAAFERALPMMMTAAGTVPAARVFVMGVGVAGLQAIATARRMGAIVTATDVRPGGQGAGGLARREIHRGRGRGVQAGRDLRRLRQGNVRRLQEEAGGAGGRARQEPGHRHHHGADSRDARRRSSSPRR